MATGYGVCFHIVYGHRAISCMGVKRQAGQNRTEAARRSYGNSAMQVQLACSLRRFRTEIIRRSWGPYKGRAEMVR